jgi:hypothetical protein
LTCLHYEAAEAVDDDVVLVEPVLPDLGAGGDDSRPAVGGQARRKAVSWTMGAQPVRSMVI